MDKIGDAIIATDKSEVTSVRTILHSMSDTASAPPGPSLRRRPWNQFSTGWKLALWLLVTLRVALAITGLVSIHLQPITSVGGNWLSLIIHGDDGWHLLLSMWQRYDALWYQQIAEHGYRSDNSTIVFYPFYPLLSRITSAVVGGHVVIAELLVSSTAFAAAMWLLYKVARLDVGPFAAQMAVLLTAFFPVGFFLLAPFTESLYLALSLSAFWCARSGRPWAAGVAGFAASLTRIQGVFLILPLAYIYLRHRQQQGSRLFSADSIGGVSAALPGLGFLSVVAYDRFAVGSRTSPLGSEAKWGYHIVAPWKALGDSLAHIGSKGDLIEALNLVSLLSFALLALWVAQRLPLAYTLYVVPYLAILFTHDEFFSPLMSVSRYMLVLFPCFIVLARWLVGRPWLAASTLLTSVLLQVTIFQYWVHFSFVA